MGPSMLNLEGALMPRRMRMVLQCRTEQRIARFNLCKKGQGPLVMETTLIGLEEPKGWCTFEFEWVFCPLKKINLVHALLHRTSWKPLPRSDRPTRAHPCKCFCPNCFCHSSPWVDSTDVAMTPVTSKNLNLQLFTSDSVSQETWDLNEACFIVQGIPPPNTPTKKTTILIPLAILLVAFVDGENMSISNGFSWPPRKTKGMFYSSSHLYSPETHQWDLKMLLLASSGSFVAVTWTKLMSMCHCRCLRRIKNHAKVLHVSTFLPWARSIYSTSQGFVTKNLRVFLINLCT